MLVWHDRELCLACHPRSAPLVYHAKTQFFMQNTQEHRAGANKSAMLGGALQCACACSLQLSRIYTELFLDLLPDRLAVHKEGHKRIGKASRERFAAGAIYPLQKYRIRSDRSYALQISIPRQNSMTDSICHAELICIAIATSTILLQFILLKAWSNHQLYVKWMTRFFTYLDRYSIGERNKLLSKLVCNARLTLRANTVSVMQKLR